MSTAPGSPVTPSPYRSARRPRAVTGIAAAGVLLGWLPAQPASAEHTPLPERVTLMGSLQSEIGCEQDWDEVCASTDLSAVAGSPTLFDAVFAVPAGTYEYKVRLDGSWEQSYGRGDDNAPLVLQAPAQLRFTYDHATHEVSVAAAQAPTGLLPGDEELVRSSLRQDLTRERFYFVMADRFEDGDPSNNTGGYDGDRLTSGYDPTDKGFYHGGDLRGILDRLDYIEGLGTTAIWLTPSFKNKPVQGAGEDASAGYHGYWITDFTQIDPHLGTNEELKELTDAAHERGIKVFFDIITNHTADVIAYADGASQYISKEDQPYRDASGEVFDDREYAGTQQFPPLDPQVSFPYTPLFPDPGDETVKFPEWLNDPTLYHNRGNAQFNGGESDLYGDFVGLDDLFTEHPTVVDGMTEIYQAWTDFGIDGFRIDTVKHVNMEFWQEFAPAITEHAAANGNEDFFSFGEVFDGNPEFLSRYTTEGRMQATIDFGFQSRATSFGRGGATTALQDFYAADDYYTDADSNAYLLPTFLGNHDMGRIGSFLRTDADGGEVTGEELLQRDKLTHALMYLTRGQPVIYYGDEQGFTGDGGDKDARQDMFASLVDSYNDDDLIGTDATTAEANFDPDHPMYRWIAELSALREEHPALADGAQVHRYATDGPGVYAFSRIGEDDREYLVAANNSEQAQTVTFDTFNERRVFQGLWPAGTCHLHSSASGEVTVTVPPLSTVVWRAAAPLKKAKEAPRPIFTLGDTVSGRGEVGVDLADDDPAEVTFAYRPVGTTDWTVLGTDDNAPYRVFHDVRDIADGTLLEYRAVVQDHSGNLAAAGSTASVAPVPAPVVGAPDDVGDGGLVLQPEAVSVPGDLNTAMGCSGNWDPACEQAQMTLDPQSQLWQLTVDLPAGQYSYKAAVNRSWDENYGAGAAADGGNIALDHPGGPVTFTYDHASHWITSDVQDPIVTAPGSFQDELGCSADWTPDCMRPWLQDLNGDGTYTWVTTQLPAGDYETKITHGLSWEENYGQGGAPEGANIAFTVPEDAAGTVFLYDSVSHLLTVTSG